MESFFYIAGQFDEIELKEFLLRRYSNIDYLLNMDISDLSDFIKLAKENETAELIRSEWIAMLPSMFAGIVKYVSYEEYLERRTGKNLDLRPADEIIAEIMVLHGMEGGI